MHELGDLPLLITSFEFGCCSVMSLAMLLVQKQDPTDAPRLSLLRISLLVLAYVLAVEVRRGDIETLDGEMLPAYGDTVHADGTGRDPALRRPNAPYPLALAGIITASELRLSPGSPRALP